MKTQVLHHPGIQGLFGDQPGLYRKQGFIHGRWIALEIENGAIDDLISLPVKEGREFVVTDQVGEIFAQLYRIPFDLQPRHVGHVEHRRHGEKSELVITPALPLDVEPLAEQETVKISVVEMVFLFQRQGAGIGVEKKEIVIRLCCTSIRYIPHFLLADGPPGILILLERSVNDARKIDKDINEKKTVKEQLQTGELPLRPAQPEKQYDGGQPKC